MCNGHAIIAGPKGPAARGAIPHAASLGLSDEGVVAETCSTASTAAFRLLGILRAPSDNGTGRPRRASACEFKPVAALALAENPGARAAIGWKARRQVRLGSVLTRSEAEAAPGVLRAPSRQRQDRSQMCLGVVNSNRSSL